MATLLCNQEAPQEQGFLSFLETLPEKASTTFRFFERNDYYTVHGSDAIFAAKEVFKTLSVIKSLGSGSKTIESVCLSKLNFESLIRDLLFVRQYRVEIYRNVGTGKSQEWSLQCKASPGNLTQLEDLLFVGSGGASDLVDSKGVMAVKLVTDNQQMVVGVGFGDAILRKFIVCEFPDNESFSNFQALAVQLSPKECLLATTDSNPNAEKLKNIIKRNEILISDCKPGDFNSKDIVQDLNRLLKFKKGTQSQSSMLDEMDLRHAMSGIAAIIKYFELLRDESNFGQFSISTFNLKQYMRLDAAAVRALGLFPLSTEDNKSQSLLGLLNKCRTSCGQRLLTQWLKQPLMDVNKIEERLDIVESFVINTELRQALYEDHLRKIPDLHRMSKKFQTKKASLQDCYKVYLMLNNLPYLCGCIEKHNGPHSPVLKEMFYEPLKELIDDFAKFVEMVNTTLDLEQVENGEFMVKADFDQDLADLRVQMEKIQDLIGAQLPKVAKDVGLEPDKTIKLENCSQIGYYFRVTRKEEKALRNKKNYFTIDTKQNGVRFHNSALKELNESYLSLRSDYEVHQRSVVELIIDTAAGYSIPMYQLGEIISHLDVLVAFALAAFCAPKPYVRPKVLQKGKGIICLKQARHPCLEVQEQADFIPNDVSLETGKKNFNIITGPNMGGKSTFIRSVALTVLMAQIGSFVPCDEAEISVVDAVLTRVGAGDRQIKGVSTFMAEMLEVSSILKCASSDSLIIIDELGRGTSTYDGFGLAWAISEHIVKHIKAHCLFATHFHELTALADEVDTVSNLQVTALTSDENITFLYRVKSGICDQSFGIHVAEMAHFPKSVIEYAKERVNEFEEFQASMICSEGYEPNLKKCKTIYEEANLLIDAFFHDVKQINCDALTEDEAMQALNKLKNNIKTSDNPFILELLSKC